MSSLKRTQTDTQDNVISRREASKRSEFLIPTLTKKNKQHRNKNNFMSSLKKAETDTQDNVRSRREASKGYEFPIPQLTKKTKQMKKK